MLWTNVIKVLEKSQIGNYVKLTDYKTDILSKMIIPDNKNDNKNDNKESETPINDSEILAQDISYLFKKPWSKLSNIHKIVKIKEYIRSLDYSQSVKSKVEKNLMELLKKRKLKKEDFVYDEVLGKIISIHNLSKINL